MDRRTPAIVGMSLIRQHWWKEIKHFTLSGVHAEMIITIIPQPVQDGHVGESKSEQHLVEKGHEWAPDSTLCTISAAEFHVYTIFTKSHYYFNSKSALLTSHSVILLKYTISQHRV